MKTKITILPSLTKIKIKRIKRIDQSILELGFRIKSPQAEKVEIA